MSQMTEDQEILFNRLVDRIGPLLANTLPAEYPHLIQQLGRTRPGDRNRLYLIIGLALCRAGADRDAVFTALRSMGVIH